MKRVAAVVAIPVLMALTLMAVAPAGLLIAGPGRAVAQDRTLDVDRTLILQLDEVSPRVVTTGGPDIFTVSGTLTNTGRQPVEDLVARVQRGDPLTTEGQLRDALDGSAGTDAVAPQFVPLTGELTPGQRVPVRLSVPLRGPPDSSLAIAGTGVYELLVNVNGAPQGGDRARLAAVRLLLPVLSLPGLSPPAASPASGGNPDPTPPAGPALPFTLLYPIADTPRRVQGVPGETLLVDDGLAASFGPDGRLGGLVEALVTAAPAGSPVRAATCVAVDPDLVETALAMQDGYSVRGPDGAPVPGAGAETARQWLDRLATAVRGGCVLALPYADADLVALTRGGLRARATAAVLDGRRAVEQVLQTPVVPGLTWPADGVTDESTLDTIGAAEGRALVLSADGIERGRSRPTAGVVPIAGGNPSQFAVLADPLLSVAASGPDETAEPVSTGSGGAVVASTPAGTDTALSTQDAIGALAFRAATGQPSTNGAPLVLAPPHQWRAERRGAGALLAAAAQLIDAGRFTPLGLDAVVAAGPPTGAQTRTLTYPIDAGGREIPGVAVATIGMAVDELTDLRSAVVEDSGVGIAPDDVFGPLTRGVVRPASAAFRGRPAESAAAADAGLAQVSRIRDLIRVLEPPSPYSLGTSDAPLPLTVANGLPLTVRVRIEVSSTSGLRVAPIPELQIPPLGRRQLSANAQVTRSGRFTVDAAVRTPDGGLLGPPSRLQVSSTAYGTITVWLTAGGGVLLVILMVRRIVRRIRGEPGRPVLAPTGPPPAPSVPPPAPSVPGPRTTAGIAPAPEDLAPTGKADETRNVGSRTDRIPVAEAPTPVPGRRPPDRPLRPGP